MEEVFFLAECFSRSNFNNVGFGDGKEEVERYRGGLICLSIVISQ